jgi:uncharacterized repeat protein (TIGR01451 family)
MRIPRGPRTTHGRARVTTIQRLLLSMAAIFAPQAFAQACPAALETSQLFVYSGAPTTFTVPANVNSIRVIAIGADGGERTDVAFAGGAGARAEGTFAVASGDVVTIVAGESPPGGDLESGGGGASGAYLSAALAVLAGGGGGDDNTGNGGGGTATNDGSAGGSPAGGDCTAGGLGGTAGAGGQFGELSPTVSQACQTGDGGSGGGGFLSAGGTSDDVAVAAPGHSGSSGGARCAIAGAAGGIAGLRDPTDGGSDGARGGFGLCGGGGADHRESGGGGGYSGGGGGSEGTFPGGGGSFVAASATTPTLVAGATGGGSGRNGSVRVCYTTQANLAITKDDGQITRVTGSTTAYTITVSNGGAASANGALFKDSGVAGLNCTSAVCSASGGAQCPGGAVNGVGVSVPVASVQSGVAIPTLPTTGSVVFTLTCTVTATGQ